eukprot:COSAG01_NODE_26076_length_724_cov_0.995200_2_plen_53_part_01
MTAVIALEGHPCWSSAPIACNCVRVCLRRKVPQPELLMGVPSDWEVSAWHANI